MRLLLGALLFGVSQGAVVETNATSRPAESQASVDARLHLVEVCPEVTTKCGVPNSTVAEIPTLVAALDCMLKVNISTVEPGPCYDALKTFLTQHQPGAPPQPRFSMGPLPFPLSLQRVNIPQVVLFRAPQTPSQMPPAVGRPPMGPSVPRPPMGAPPPPMVGRPPMMGRPPMDLRSPLYEDDDDDSFMRKPFWMRDDDDDERMSGWRGMPRPPMGPPMGMRPPMRPPMGMRPPFWRGGDDDDDDDDSFMGRHSRYGPGPRKPFWMHDDEDDDRSPRWRGMPHPPMGRPPMGRPPFKPFWMHDEDDDRSPRGMPHRPMGRPPMGRPPFKPFWMRDDEDRKPFWMHDRKPSWRDEDDDEDRKPFWMNDRKSSWMDRKPSWMNRKPSWMDEDDDDEDRKPFWMRGDEKPSWMSRGRGPRPPVMGRSYGSSHQQPFWMKHRDNDRMSSWRNKYGSRSYDHDKFAYKPSFHSSSRGSHMPPPPPHMPFSHGSPLGQMPPRMPPRMSPRRPSPQSSGPSPMLMMMLPKLMGGSGPQNPMATIMQIMLQSKLLAASNNNDDYDYDYDYDYAGDYDYEDDEEGSDDYDYDYDYDDSSSSEGSSLIDSLLQRMGGQPQPHVTITQLIPAEEPSEEESSVEQHPVEVSQQSPAVEVRDPAKKEANKEAPASEQVSYRNLP